MDSCNPLQMDRSFCFITESETILHSIFDRFCDLCDYSISAFKCDSRASLNLPLSRDLVRGNSELYS